MWSLSIDLPIQTLYKLEYNLQNTQVMVCWDCENYIQTTFPTSVYFVWKIITFITFKKPKSRIQLPPLIISIRYQLRISVRLPGCNVLCGNYLSELKARKHPPTCPWFCSSSQCSNIFSCKNSKKCLRTVLYQGEGNTHKHWRLAVL